MVQEYDDVICPCTSQVAVKCMRRDRIAEIIPPYLGRNGPCRRAVQPFDGLRGGRAQGETACGAKACKKYR